MTGTVYCRYAERITVNVEYLEEPQVEGIPEALDWASDCQPFRSKYLSIRRKSTAHTRSC
jgi:hypothetical protein